jgi:hypothetical protein
LVRCVVFFIDSHCSRIENIHFVLSGVGTDDGDTFDASLKKKKHKKHRKNIGVDHAKYIDDTFRGSDATWKICVWHKNQRAYQIGNKVDETGYEVYEACRRHGAMVLSGTLIPCKLISRPLAHVRKDVSDESL